LGEQQKVWVYVPDGANQTNHVVYLLDGDAHFYSVVGMIQQLSSVNGNTMCPKMIVVGITIICSMHTSASTQVCGGTMKNC
jgi:predicted alpha/beta superfamily hydrolase